MAMSDDANLENLGAENDPPFPRLTAELARLYRTSDAPPSRENLAAMDQAILRAAGEHLSPQPLLMVRRSTFRLPARSWRWAAAAAAVALLAVVWMPGRRSAQPPVPMASLPGDVDASGNIDILDAFTLARHTRDRQPVNPIHDLNGDGRIDQLDIDAIAAKAVALDHPVVAVRRWRGVERDAAVGWVAAVGWASRPPVQTTSTLTDQTSTPLSSRPSTSIVLTHASLKGAPR